MQRQRRPAIAENPASQHDQSEQDATSEPESEPRYYANPELLAKKCRQLEKIPFVLVEPEPRSEQSKKRIQMLEEEFRLALKNGLKPRLELESTVLGGPLIGGWPKVEEEDADLDYPLAETEEEWFAWKRMIDEKRARRRLLISGGLNKDTETSRVAERDKPTGAKDTGVSQPPSVTPVKGKENGRSKVSRSSRIVAPEVEWNDQSIEGALQSTPIRREQGFVPTPQAPGRQVAPDSRFQPRPTTPFADLQAPKNLQGIGEGRSSHPIPVGLQYSQHKSNGSGLRRQNNSFVSLMHPASSESLPGASVAPAFKQMPNTTLMSPSNGIMSRESVENWRKQSALVNSQESVSQPRSERQHSQDYVPSPTTTHYLYGSQNSQPLPPPQLNPSNSYGRELEEELERERQIFDFHKAVNGYSKQPRGAWNVGAFEEDTQFKSQEARAVSSFIENDLGPHLDHNEGPYDD